MTIPFIISVLAGMAIGLRFRVLMILPAIVAGVLLTATITFVQGEHIWTIISASGLSAIGVQIGYLCGTFVYSQKEAQVPASASPPTLPADAYLPQNRMRIPVQSLD